MFVVSIDLRRSTELMLKAKKPELYADFISNFCMSIMDRVMKLNGVVDKFTGDGVLAYFPDFFTGKNASSNAIDLAMSSHRIFADVIKSHHGAFKTVLDDVGVGVGVDYGSCQVVRLGGTVSIVGEPVVYACRFASAPPGNTFFNRSGYDRILEEQGKRVSFKEVSTEIKHEGRVIAYSLEGYGELLHEREPEWRTYIVAAPSADESVESKDE